MIYSRAVCPCLVVLALVCNASFAQRDTRLWKPAEDEVYLQEVGDIIRTAKPITALAVHGSTLYANVGGALKTLDENTFRDVADAPENVQGLWDLDSALWATTNRGVFRFSGDAWQQVGDVPMVDLCLHLGTVHGATHGDLFRFEGGAFVNIKPESGFRSSDTTLIRADGSQVLADPVRIGPIRRIASYSGTLYILRPQGLALIDRQVFVPNPIDWGALPSDSLRDLLVQGSRLYVTTGRGIAVLRGMAMTTLSGKNGLPYEDTTCLARGFGGDLWIGTTNGAIRKAGGQYHFFGADHWLPGGNVRDISVDEDIVYIGTDAGLGIIRYSPFTLLKKAAYFERELYDWGHMRLGFIHKLYWSGDENSWLREISDNDGGHTAHYLAAMSFKYAVTGDEQDRLKAIEAFKAMIWLEAITPKVGFVARAIWSVSADKGKRSERGSGGLPAKWYPTDDGQWQWKGDTSSDEINAHMYSVSLFHDLVAEGAEKKRAKEHIFRIAAHIVDNGWVLRDMDGQPTRWGRWDPEYLLRPYGHEARGLNGMEAQTYMWTALSLTGDLKFERGLQQLLEWRYHTYTVRQKRTFPPDSVVPWDDELAFRCYHPLLTYANDPELRSIYLRSLERSWEVMRMQKVPFFNFIYGALTGNDCEVEQAVQHLREWSLDTVSHDYRNSHRSDLAPEPGYVPYSGGTRAMSPRETAAMWGSRSAIRYDGGGGGKTVTPAAGWLEDYWMGRYYGFIKAPRITDPTLVTLSPRSAKTRGAEPYNGPARPDNLILNH